jgi:fucose 4-O-acetylase-like acetyltransferase
MVSVLKKKIKQIIFPFLLVIAIYIVHLTIQDFYRMFQGLDYELALSETLRLLKGEFKWYEEYLFSFLYAIYFSGALFNLVAVVYSERPPFSSLRVLYKYRSIL